MKKHWKKTDQYLRRRENGKENDVRIMLVVYLPYSQGSKVIPQNMADVITFQNVWVKLIANYST